jgi:hypothetical protein
MSSLAPRAAHEVNGPFFAMSFSLPMIFWRCCQPQEALIEEMLALPKLGCFRTDKPADRHGVELVFGAEVLIETTAGKTCVLHDFVDRHLVEASTVEEPTG